eukprot:124864_1
MALSATPKCNNNSNQIINNNTTKSVKPKQPTRKPLRYIPPHLRGKGTKTFTNINSNHSIKNNEQKQQNNPYKSTKKRINPYHKSQINNNNTNNTFIWYNNEKEFECKLGMS